MPVDYQENSDGYLRSCAQLFRLLRENERHVWPVGELAYALDWSAEKLTTYLGHLDRLDKEIFTRGVLGEEHEHHFTGLSRCKYVGIGDAMRRCHRGGCEEEPALYTIYMRQVTPSCPMHEAADIATSLLHQGVLDTVSMGDFVVLLSEKIEDAHDVPDDDVIWATLEDVGIDADEW